MTENQLLYSDMVPVQKIHGERNGEIVSRIWKKNQEVKSNGWNNLKAASNLSDLMPLFFCFRIFSFLVSKKSTFWKPPELFFYYTPDRLKNRGKTQQRLQPSFFFPKPKWMQSINIPYRKRFFQKIRLGHDRRFQSCVCPQKSLHPEMPCSPFASPPVCRQSRSQTPGQTE